MAALNITLNSFERTKPWKDIIAYDLDSTVNMGASTNDAIEN